MVLKEDELEFVFQKKRNMQWRISSAGTCKLRKIHGLWDIITQLWTVSRLKVGPGA